MLVTRPLGKQWPLGKHQADAQQPEATSPTELMNSRFLKKGHFYLIICLDFFYVFQILLSLDQHSNKLQFNKIQVGSHQILN